MGSPKGVGESSRDRLRRQLAERTGTRAKDWHVVFKARYGMEVVFEVLRELRGGGSVVTQLMTCCTAVDPIVAAGLVPHYGELSECTLALDPAKLPLASDLRAVVLQHSFGIIERKGDCRLADAAHAAGAVLVEDSAHCLARLSRGNEGEPLADVSVHSFGVQKMVQTYFGGAVWVNPDMRDRALKDELSCRLSSLPEMPRRLGRAARSYAWQIRVFMRLPGPFRKAFAAMQNFEQPIVDAERAGRLPYEPMAADEGVSQRASWALEGLDKVEATHRASVESYRRELASQGALRSIEVPAAALEGEAQPLLRLPVVMGSQAKAQRALSALRGRGIYAQDWYRPVLYPGAGDPVAYHFDGDLRPWPVCERIVAGILNLPCDGDPGQVRETIGCLLDVAQS